MSSKKVFAWSVWSKNVLSTTKPSFATLIPGCSTSASFIVPYLCSALSHVSSVPGTPTDSPLHRAALNGSGAPFSQNDVGVIATGAVSPSPPAAATAASAALPPAFKVAIAPCVASVSAVAAAPPVPTDVGGPDGATSADAATPKTSAATKDRMTIARRITSPWARGAGGEAHESGL